MDFEKGNTSKQINAEQQMKFIAAKQTLKKKFTWNPSFESIGWNISVPKDSVIICGYGRLKTTGMYKGKLFNTYQGKLYL